VLRSKGEGLGAWGLEHGARSMGQGAQGKERGAWGEGPTGNSGERKAERRKKKAESVKWRA